ncbi:MAG: tRNA uridine-5-carboxymethylaminomethyl(34) synthesis GTPase MnmE [Pseudomonadales bacterium]|nr:tRNA uridine-5-carboxymethylaminomethyl(34) synthesis GTPase MnmE [Pseudomonadales bacterium]
MKTTIAAIATPPGQGGVGIVRVSGPYSLRIVLAITQDKAQPEPRKAYLKRFIDNDARVIDTGLLLYFKAPHSFTGEDVVELQVHGSPMVLNMLLRQICQQGASMARPGEFSERAYLNGCMDLAQAEAVADLIAAGSEQAARSAQNSLQGEFSRHVQSIVQNLITLRVHVEAAIDFSEEETQWLGDTYTEQLGKTVLEDLGQCLQVAEQGVLLQTGMKIVIAGRPNVGKSSLLNALSGQDLAIVSDTAGTTRDLIHQQINIEGMPLHIVDTAGLHNTHDPIEQEGIRRALHEVDRADGMLFLVDAHADAHQELEHMASHMSKLPSPDKLLLVRNKTDILADPDPALSLEFAGKPYLMLPISVKTGAGLQALKREIAQRAGRQPGEVPYSARIRHTDALRRGQAAMTHALEQLQHGFADLAAEDLRTVQGALGEITGTFTTDDLLTRIFSSFCLGK